MKTMLSIFNFFAGFLPARTPEQLILRIAEKHFGRDSFEARLAKNNPVEFLLEGKRSLSSRAHNIPSSERAKIHIWRDVLDELRYVQVSFDNTLKFISLPRPKPAEYHL